MQKSSLILAHISLYGLMGPNYCERLVKSVLDYRKSARPELRGQLDATLNKLLQIKGFKTPTKAPTSRLADETLKHLFCCRGMLESILNIWIESRSDLSNFVEEYLSGPDVELAGIFKIEGEAVVGWKEEMQAVIADIKTVALGHEEDDIALMICCLSTESQAQLSVKEVGDHVVEEGEVINKAKASVFPSNEDDKSIMNESGIKSLKLKGWLNDLAALDSDAAEWSEIEIFTQAVSSLAGIKREAQFAAIRELQRVLSNFIAEHREDLNFFGPHSCSEWSADVCSPSEAIVITVKIEELSKALDRHTELQRQPWTDLNEARERRNALTVIEDGILHLLDELQSALAQERPASSEGQTLQEDAPIEAANATESDNSAAETGVKNSDSAQEDELFSKFGEKVESRSESIVLASDSSISTNDEESAQTVRFGQEAAANERIAVTPDTADSETEADIMTAGSIEEPKPPATEAVIEALARAEDDSAAPKADVNLSKEVATPVISSPHSKEQSSYEAKEVIEQPVYLFGTEQPTLEIARSILHAEVRPRRVALRDLVWRLVLEGRFDLAFHLTIGCEVEGYGSQPHLPSWLLRAVTLGRHIRHPNGNIAHHLRDDFALFNEDCFIGGDSDWDHGVRLLCAAAAMRPALLAPSTNASSVLHKLHMRQGLVNLYQCWQSIASYSDHRRPLQPIALKGIRDVAAWQAELDALKQQVGEWVARAPSLQVYFSRATQVWRKWQQSGQLVHTLLMPILCNDISKLPDVKALVERLSDDSEIKREIDKTDQRLLKRRPGEDIMARAFAYLRNHLLTAASFVQQWIELQEARPGRVKTFDQQQAEYLSHEIYSRRDAVRAELDAFEERHQSFFVSVGVRVCRQAYEDLWTLFDSETTISIDEPDPKHMLYGELLKLPSLQLNERWEPQGGVEVIDAVLKFLADDDVNWRSILEIRSAQFDHLATGRILEYLESQDGAAALFEELRQLREQRIADCRDTLEREIKATKEDIEGAVALGLLREKEHVDISATVGAIEAALPETLHFNDSYIRLREVREEIKYKREGEVEVVRQRLQSAGVGPDHAAYERIIGVLDRGDVSTANEYIDLIVHKRQLPSEEASSNTFIKFFPKIYKELNEVMEHAPSAARAEPFKIISDIRAYSKWQIRNYSIGPVEMKRVGGKQAERAADMLEAWFNSKMSKSIDRLGAKRILSNLGFSPLDIDVNQITGRKWIRLITEPIKDRGQCPIPAFGSDGRGRYQILCVWDRPTEGDLLNYVSNTSQGGPILVFYFGRMTEQSRRDLARRCRQRHLTFIVIDDTLMFYLCAEPEPRLLTMFECTLPFTFAEPYTTTAGLVPIEMFYGREQERRSIMDPMGSCFIYGGRQLGKTALLRDVERRFNDSQKKIALWFDIKANGIGLDKKFDDIWGLLATELHRLGVSISTTRQVTLDKFLEYVLHWLEEDETRQLLLLLDEADDFLVYDGRASDDNKTHMGEFMRAARLKGVMDRTHRRFKVVFAGLHNVQRTTRMSNHPLAHYGDPICIGPLLDNGEWREARELIERPLATLGYSFETPDLVDRILWQTNYYPSLIQLYCNYLLKHITNAHHALTLDSKASPPYVITSKHVEEAYLSHDLRKAIRDRMLWTLQLDERYEVIAYAIALGSLTDKESSMAEGFQVSWVRKEALFWWPDGFRESDSDDLIRTLLDEMVGLGILRMVNPSHYALRSTNVVVLMGTEEEIEAALLRSREVPLQYEPATFRAAMNARSNTEEILLRSPLTAQQESDLRSRTNGVSIIIGCGAAGIDHVAPRLETVFGGDYFVNIDGTIDKAGLERRLSELAGRERQGTTLVYVPTSCPWSGLWVDEALQKLKKLRSKFSYVRVAFVANPTTAWQIVNDETNCLDDLILAGVTTFSLRPLHDAALRQWLDDLRFVSDQAVRERIAEATGNWLILLCRFFGHARPETLMIERGLIELSKEAQKRGAVSELAGLWGLDNPEALRTFQYLDTGAATADELAQSLNDVMPEVMQKRLLWAYHLGLINSLGDGRWCIDKAVSQSLNALRD